MNQNSCRMCEDHQTTIIRLQQTLSKLNDQYETIKSQYQRLISAEHTPTKHDIPITTRRHHYSLSTRLNRKYQGLFY